MTAINDAVARAAERGISLGGAERMSVEEVRPLFVGLPVSADEADAFASFMSEQMMQAAEDGLPLGAVLKTTIAFALLIGMLAEDEP